MKIDQLMDKESRAQYQLLVYLYERKDGASIKEVLQKMGLTKVTLIKYISNLNTLFQENNLSCIVCVDDINIKVLEKHHFTWQEVISLLLQNSISYQILKYLMCNEFFNVTFLAQELAVSEATFNRQLSFINSCLEEFDIAIYQGKQVGSELNWRYFYFELFQVTLTEYEWKKMCSDLDFDHLSYLCEKIIGEKLPTKKVSDLALWLAISQKRLLFQKDKKLPLHIEVDYIEENVFYKRLERLKLRFLSRYAIEFDRFESKSLFIFLHSHHILPIRTMEYILGFGGPISDKISEALWLLKKAQIIADKTKEEIIYALGIFFSKSTFFNGTILASDSNDKTLYQLVSDEDIDKIELVLRHLFILCGDKVESSDLAIQLRSYLLELLVFSIERHHKPLKIALEIGAHSVKNAMIQLSIQSYLDNNRNYQFVSLSEKADCLITFENRIQELAIPHFHLKSYTSPFELSELQLFLEDRLKAKNSPLEYK
ncbi:helix-turn-helix domain-containing protein [Streptococcus uberis]|uniref:helix-turn-helix domain-containing protein n=1 Tax=Streptococcus uberis TaxID=1349 RepID=UPI001C9465D2|nr:helix-turn-helix domain-containing protein [Streptococcus uberis]MBY4765446.1 helix-turn-helix domain-containing protein [Streptococcus uberis]